MNLVKIYSFSSTILILVAIFSIAFIIYNLKDNYNKYLFASPFETLTNDSSYNLDNTLKFSDLFWFGAEFLDITPEMINEIGLNENTSGILVTYVYPDGPAERAGLRGGYTYSNLDIKINLHPLKIGGDIILKLNNNNISNLSDFYSLIQTTNREKIQDKVNLTILRDGELKQISLSPVVHPDFLVYKSQYDKFKISYTSDWKFYEDKPESRNYKNEAVLFYKDSNLMETIQVSVDDEFTENLFVNNVFNYETHLDLTIHKLKEYNDLKIIESETNIPFANQYGYRLTYTFTDENGYSIKETEFGTFFNDKMYRIVYSADIDRFSYFLNIFQNMINSFEIEPNISSMSNMTIQNINNISSNQLNEESLDDYTLMVYMIGSDLESSTYDATKDILEMKAANSSAKVNVVVETGGSNAKPTADNKRFIDFTKVQRHHVTNGQVHTLQDKKEKNMGDPRTLSDFIIWAVSEFPAKRYAIILWDHGSGINGFGKDVIFENDALDLEELEKAFLDAQTVTKQKFEIIGFDACIMNSIDIAYRMSSVGNYMIASEDIEPSWGWNYRSILTNLANNPSQNGTGLGIATVNSYYNSSIQNAKSEEFDIEQILTLSVIDLRKIIELTKELDDLSLNLYSNLSDYSTVLSFINTIEFSKSYGGTNPNLVDLDHLLSNIASKFPHLRDQIYEIQNTLKDSIIHPIYNNKKSNSHGLSIYMPLDRTSVSNNGIHGVKSWQNMINFQQELLMADHDLPKVQSFYDNRIIKGQILSKDISKIELFLKQNLISYNSEIPGNNIIINQEIPKRDFVDSNGLFEYNISRPFLSLCNEDKCIPIRTHANIEGNTTFLSIPVQLEKSTNNFSQNVLLTYSMTNQGTFDFLGARPALSGSETIPKQILSLEPTDKIRSQIFTSDGRIEGFNIMIMLSDPIQINSLKNFGPKFSNSTNNYDIMFHICDYSENCGGTRWYHFGNEINKELKHLEYNNTTIKDNNYISNFDIYTNPYYNFTMSYPLEWQKVDNGLRDPVIVKFIEPQKSLFDNILDSFTVSVEYLPGLPSLKEVAEIWIEKGKNSIPAFQILESNETIIADSYPSHKLIVKYRDRDATMKEMDVRTRIGDLYYTFQLTTTEREFNHYQSIVDNMIGTFKTYFDDRDIEEIYTNKHNIPEHEKENIVYENKNDKYILFNMNYSNFSSYVNKDYKFRINYPSPWFKIEESSSIRFASPFEDKINRSGFFVEDNLNEEFSIDITPKADLPPLEYLVNSTLLLNKKNMPGFKIIDTNKTTFQGSEAYFVLYTYFNLEGRLQVKELNIYTILGESFYLLGYTSTPSNYERYLPIINEMLRTFSIINTTKSVETFKDSINNFSIQYPSGWEVEHILGPKEGDMKDPFQDKYIFNLPDDDQRKISSPTIMLYIQDLSYSTLIGEEQLQYVTNRIISEYENLQSQGISIGIVEMGKTIISKTPAEFIIYNEHYEGLNYQIKRLEAYTIINDKLYTIIYTTLASNYNKNLPIALNMINSLRVENIDGNTDN
jgi:hypothetical protein